MSRSHLLAGRKSLKGVAWCSDDDEKEEDVSLSRNERMALERQALIRLDSLDTSINVISITDNSIVPPELQLEDCSDFEDEEYRLGSPSGKKRRKHGTKSITLNPMTAKSVLRTRLISGWTDIVLLQPEASKAGKRAAAKSSREEQQFEISIFAEDKSENTLAQRLGPVKGYVKWISDDLSKWPPSEELLSQYIAWAVNERSGKTKTKRTIEAIAFTGHTFEFSIIVRRIGESRYLNGLATRALKTMPPRRRAIPFFFEHICIIEVAVARRLLSGPLYMVLGVALTLAYFRSRFNDPDFIIRFEVFSDRMELQVRDTKTSKITQEVIMLAPVETLTGLDWMNEFRLWREEQGAPLEAGWPLMPSLVNGEWVRSQARNGDFNTLLNAGLQALRIEIRKLAHDLKATFLDGAVIFGIEKEHRYRLGYHVDSNDRALDSYAASNQVIPLKKMTQMIVAYRDGEFDPDQTRKAKPIDRMRPHEPQEQDESGSEVGSNGSQVASDVEAIAEAELVSAQSDELKIDNRWFENVTNSKLHRGRYGEHDVTACGNYVGGTLQLMASGLEAYEPSLNYCQTCFGKTYEKQAEIVRLMSEPLQYFLSSNLR